MTKYYRVRSQEQWDWLANKLNIYCVKSMGCPVIIKHEQGQKYYQIIQYCGGSEPVIEVSKLMEDEKMENIDAYQEVAKKYPLSADDVRDILCHHVVSGSTLKIKMTKAEKDEFDALKRRALTLIACFGMINKFGYPHLDERLHGNNEIGQNNLAQNEFARAWADPSLIEVITEKKWNVKVPPFERTSRYYYKHGGKLSGAHSVSNDDEDQQFTADELKEYGLGDDMFEKVEVKE